MILDSKKMELIRQGKYEWSDEEVKEVYNFAGFVAKKFRNSINENYYDIVQDLVTDFFVNKVKKYDPSRGNCALSTFICCVFTNDLLIKIRNKKAKKRSANIVSLDDIVIKSDMHSNKDLNLKEVVESDYETPSQKYENDLRDSFIKSKLQENKLLNDFYVNNLNQNELAKIYGLSQAQISRKLTKEIKNAKDEIKELGL